MIWILWVTMTTTVLCGPAGTPCQQPEVIRQELASYATQQDCETGKTPYRAVYERRAEGEVQGMKITTSAQLSCVAERREGK